MTSTAVISVVIPSFENGAQVSRLVRQLLEQELPSHVGMEIRIVDDGSAQPLQPSLHAQFGSRYTILRHPINRGRAAARNTGARGAEGASLLFLDSDCIPAGQRLIGAHLRAMQGNTDLSFGPLVNTGSDFWSRYQRQVSERRLRALDNGRIDLQTAANFCVKKDLFERAGGFDERYREYGFEDRDFMLRLKQLGAHATLAPEAGVIHLDTLNLSRICRKFEVAGRCTSSLFRAEHSEAYRADYGRFDVRENWTARMLAHVAKSFLPAWVHWWGPRVESGCIPLSVRRLAVQGACALAYARGTALAAAG